MEVIVYRIFFVMFGCVRGKSQDWMIKCRYTGGIEYGMDAVYMVYELDAGIWGWLGDKVDTGIQGWWMMRWV